MFFKFWRWTGQEGGGKGGDYLPYIPGDLDGDLYLVCFNQDLLLLTGPSTTARFSYENLPKPGMYISVPFCMLYPSLIITAFQPIWVFRPYSILPLPVGNTGKCTRNSAGQFCQLLGILPLRF